MYNKTIYNFQFRFAVSCINANAIVLSGSMRLEDARLNEASRSGLWRRVFTIKKNDPHAESKARLVGALERMRENVGNLLKYIPADCKDLTIHDVTHLDALWDMASLVAGEEYDINPAEAFVLGAAILLHDAGLAVASYQNGLSDLRQTTEWKDISASVLRQEGLNTLEIAAGNIPENIVSHIKFAVLRALHAKQAERMATSPWKLPSGQEVYLLEDFELRQAFGSSIGRIAHSHNWDIARVAEELTDNIGSGTVLPTEWSVGERKLACILRCADAAHIDRRRAPSILFAATRPEGISAVHWGAQNKLNKPTVNKSTLIYTSGQSFKPSESDAWWLAYDLILLVEKEVRASNALLEEISAPQFRVQRVFGAGSPRALSMHVRPEHWRPIDAVIKVSDPVHLARTLGGRHLYGNDILASIREMLQNSADAIRARCQLEDRPITWGLIRVTIESAADQQNACWVHVDDNGIGMTERVLAGPLIDFGRSIWNSPILQEEFPGLQSKRVSPIGKFGIGFFSIFELGNSVRVVSKHYAAGLAEAKALEFRSLANRPLVRPAEPKELPRDFSTRVSVKIDNYDRFRSYKDPRYFATERRRRPEPSFEKSLQRLVSVLDIKLEFSNKIDGTDFIHVGDPDLSNSIVFIDELLGDRSERERERIKTTYGSLMQPLVDAEGRKWGHAALAFAERKNDILDARSMSYISVGGFTYGRDGTLAIPYVGVMSGDTDEAARRHAYSEVPQQVIKNWASRQAEIINPKRFQKSQLLNACMSIIKIGGDSGSLPFCFHMGKLISFGDAVDAIRQRDNVIIPLRLQYSTTFHVNTYSMLGANYFELEMNSNVFIIADQDDRIINDELARLITKAGRKEVVEGDLDIRSESPLEVLIGTVKQVWSRNPGMSIGGVNVFDTDLHVPPPADWALILRKTSN